MQLSVRPCFNPEKIYFFRFFDISNIKSNPKANLRTSALDISLKVIPHLIPKTIYSISKSHFCAAPKHAYIISVNENEVGPFH